MGTPKQSSWSSDRECRAGVEGEILGAANTEWPLYHGIFYGDRKNCDKLAKRLHCAIRHLPLRLSFHYESDTQKALDAGAGSDPTFVFEGKILPEGLAQAETITTLFENYLKG